MRGWGWIFRAVFFFTMTVLGLAGPALAVPFTASIDTSNLTGPGRFEFDLFPLDDQDGNNTALVAGTGFANPVVLTDPGQALLDVTLGGVFSFQLDLSANFNDGAGGLGGPDRFAIFLLDPATNFTLVDTNLDPDPQFPLDDPLAVFKLGPGGVTVAVATTTNPMVPVSVNVAEPSSLILMLVSIPVAIAARWRRRASPAVE